MVAPQYSLIQSITTLCDIVGAEYQVPVVGARKVLSPSDYIDMCHFDADGHEKVATLLYETIGNIVQDM